MLRCAVSLLLLLLPAYGRNIHFGVKGGYVSRGIPVNYGFQDAHEESKKYTFGGIAEFDLPWRFSVEVDALYQRIGYRQAPICPPFSCFSFTARANAIIVPVLAKYHFFRGPVSPYALGGVSFRHVGGATGTAYQWNVATGSVDQPISEVHQPVPYAAPSTGSTGTVVGGGIEFRAGFLRLAPEFRYTWWQSPAWQYDGPGDGYYGARANRNQTEVLLGISF